MIRADIRPCIGRNHCGMNGPCVQKDDYETKQNFKNIRWESQGQFRIRTADLPMMRAGWMIFAQRGVEKMNEN